MTLGEQSSCSLASRSRYEWTELLAPLESRTAFAAMRYTNREKPFTQKFNLSVSRIEKNQRKIRGVNIRISDDFWLSS